MDWMLRHRQICPLPPVALNKCFTNRQSCPSHHAATLLIQGCEGLEAKNFGLGLGHVLGLHAILASFSSSRQRLRSSSSYSLIVSRSPLLVSGTVCQILSLPHLPWQSSGPGLKLACLTFPTPVIVQCPRSDSGCFGHCFTYLLTHEGCPRGLSVIEITSFTLRSSLIGSCH